jgi:outer membrane lipoprotein LolB
MKIRSLAALGFVALLGACATAALAPRHPEPFDLLGRAAVTYSGGAFSANMRWEHAPGEDQFWLMTPTGQTLAHIVDAPQGAILTRADQKQHRAASVEALTRQALGWTLPLTLMQYWIKGEPAPVAADGAQRDANGRLSAITQNNWRVAFTYYGEGEARGKVRRLDMNDGPNEIRLVIDTWRDPKVP